MLEWISVNERLPENGHNVLFCKKDGNVSEGHYERRAGLNMWCQYRWSCSIPVEKVTHWMPLPEPPEASHGK